MEQATVPSVFEPSSPPTSRHEEPSRYPRWTKKSPRFLIVDDHPVVSFAMQHLLSSQDGWQVVGHAGTPNDAVAILNKLGVDAVLLDLLFPGESGLEFLSWLHRERPQTAAVVYSIQPEEVYASRCLRAGASGYVSKDASVDTLLTTIRQVLDGQSSVNGKIMNDQVKGFVRSSNARGIEKLSLRELEVLNLLGQGMSNKRIASLLCRSVKTIETHRYRISRKLNIGNGPELVHLALQHRLAAEMMPGGLESAVGQR